MIQYLLILIISYLGLFAGFFLCKISPEELNAGNKYFKFLNKIIIATLLFLLIKSFFQTAGLVYTILLGILCLFSIKINLNSGFGPQILYGIFPILLFYSSYKGNYFEIFASLIFLYGMIYTSYFLKEFTDFNNRKILLNNYTVFKKLFFRTNLYIILGVITIIIKFII